MSFVYQREFKCSFQFWVIELMINKTHGLSPPGGLVSPSGGFSSLLFDQVGRFASIKLCLVLSCQEAEIKIPVVRCHCLLCLGPQFQGRNSHKTCEYSNKLSHCSGKVEEDMGLSYIYLAVCAYSGKTKLKRLSVP